MNTFTSILLASIALGVAGAVTSAIFTRYQATETAYWKRTTAKLFGGGVGYCGVLVAVGTFNPREAVMAFLISATLIVGLDYREEQNSPQAEPPIDESR